MGRRDAPGLGSQNYSPHRPRPASERTAIKSQLFNDEPEVG